MKTRKLTFESIYFTVAVTVFVLVSINLARFNFDLHHDGYAFTQSLKLMNGELPFRDVYLQYGPLFHYILAGFILLEGNAVFASRIFATFLLVFIACIPRFLGHEQRGVWLFTAGIWLSNCYWFAPYEQYFPQFHPSQIGLLIFVFCAFLLLKLESSSVKINRSIFFLSLLTFAACLSKINFGMLLFVGTFISLYYKFGKLKFAFNYFLQFTLLVSILLLVFDMDGMSSIFSSLASHYDYAISKNLFEGIYNTFLMNERHGHVHTSMLLLYAVPSGIILLTAVRMVRKKITPDSDTTSFKPFVGDNTIILSIMAVCLWLSIYPTGAFQHIWYGGLLGLGVCLIVFRELLGLQAYKFAIYFSLLVSVLIFGNNLFQKHATLEDYEIYELEYLHEIKLAPEVGRSLQYLQDQFDNKLGDNCEILNLAPNALFVSRSDLVCSLGDGKADFIWKSEYRTSFGYGLKRFSDQNALLIADNYLPSLTRKLAFAETEFNQDHVNGFFVFDQFKDILRSELKGKRNWTKIPKVSESPLVFSKANFFDELMFVQIGKIIKYDLPCIEARQVLANDVTLPLLLKQAKHTCELEHKPEASINLLNVNFLLFHMEKQYELMPSNLYSAKKLLSDGCKVAIDKSGLTISFDIAIQRRHSLTACNHLYQADQVHVLLLGQNPEIAHVNFN